MKLESPINPPIKRKRMYRLHHVCLSVANRERSIRFYKQLDFEQFHAWEADDKSLTITHLKNGGIFLELFCYRNQLPAPETIFETQTDLPVIGTKHFGLRVNSIEAARADLSAKRLVPHDIQITQGRTGPRYFFVRDPDGILVEIAQDERDF